jgi:bacillithiol biosynthesis cysteine-adding enzyme BshC
MPFTKQTIPLRNTGLFSALFEDYISHSENTKPFFESHIYKTDIDSYLKKHEFETVNRTVLVSALKKQAALVENTSPQSLKHISLLKESNTFSVTTGHQLCLFTGPLYFVYKIVSAINLCKTLEENFPGKHFVPVYWMASEDHDFEEINHANVFGKKVTWNSAQKGSVGEFSTEGLQEVIVELKTILGESENSTVLIQLFENAYLKHSNLADATRYLVNALFGEYGLVILDGNDTELKHLFKEEFTKDIFENTPFKLVNESIEALTKHYSAQVNPREINVFYKEKGLRERIEKQGTDFTVLNTDIRFTEQELKDLVETHPEKLSPNVVLRPLYQQKILPNVAYVGGPGELAYWLEYKTMFNAFSIDFPVLMPRHFVTLIDKGTQNKIQKLNLNTEAVFKEGEDLVKQFIKTQHDDINLEKAKQGLTELYASVTETISTIDKTLMATAEAEKQKAINGLATLEQKINRALKQKSETDVNQIWAIKGKLFPNNVPQERYDNFSAFYSKYGNNFIKELAGQLAYNLNDFEYTLLVED